METRRTHRETRENEAREPFRGGRHPYWYPGKRNVVTSRSTAEKILERFLKSDKEKDGREKMKHTSSSKATTS